VVGRALPRHSSELTWRDYLALLASRNTTLEEVWQGRLGQARLFPAPTGRHALWAFLEQAPLKPGDEVLLAAYNFHPVVQILVQRGLIPVFVDIEPQTLTLDPDDLPARVSRRSRMVLVTHMFGHPADLTRIGAFCREHGLLLFEDCAHAPGTLHQGAQVGSFGDGALFSFGVYKILNSLGGGMLALSGADADRFAVPGFAARPGLGSRLETLARLVFSVGSTPGMYGLTLHPFLRFCENLLPKLARTLDPSDNDPEYRFDPAGRAPFRPFMAEMLRRQLARLESNVARRRAAAEGIRSCLGQKAESLWLQPDRHGLANASYLGVRLPDAVEGARRCRERGVGCREREYLDCSRLPQFAAWAANCPESTRAEKEILRLPSYPSLSPSDQERVADAVLRALSR
jgi:dTDP-4-amino-4,6-dideoxygalactose transaminase